MDLIFNRLNEEEKKDEDSESGHDDDGNDDDENGDDSFWSGASEPKSLRGRVNLSQLSSNVERTIIPVKNDCTVSHMLQFTSLAGMANPVICENPLYHGTNNNETPRCLSYLPTESDPRCSVFLILICVFCTYNMHLSLRFGVLYFFQFMIAQYVHSVAYFVSADYEWRNPDLKEEYMLLVNRYLYKILKVCCSDDKKGNLCHHIF